MTKREPTPYSLTKREADLLGALSIATMPKDLRTELIRSHQAAFGWDDVVNLFAEFLAVAASVEQNVRESVELFLIVDGKLDPHEAEKMNLPTLMGAMKGSQIAVGPFPGQCHGCAFRKGSYANQSLCTTSDAEMCVGDGERFNCHEDLDAQGEPTKVCVGYANARKLVKL